MCIATNTSVEYFWNKSSKSGFSGSCEDVSSFERLERKCLKKRSKRSNLERCLSGISTRDRCMAKMVGVSDKSFLGNSTLYWPRGFNYLAAQFNTQSRFDHSISLFQFFSKTILGLLRERFLQGII